MNASPTFAERTTLRVGGPADDWIVADTEEDLVAAVRACDAAGTPVLVLGGGSNLLVADAGFRGTVVQVATRGAEAEPVPGGVRATLAAGEPWDDLVSRAVAHGWSGVEALSGIPGLLGATPVQNVGAYGQDVSQVVESVRALDRHSGVVRDLTAEECAFGYRTSAFKREPGRWVVLAVTVRLRDDGLGVVRYSELATALGVETGTTAPVAAIRGAVLALRARKGMVLDPSDHDTWSAGSFFTNPVVAPEVAAAIAPECPRYPAPDGVKLSAAWLIEQSGIVKGFSVGGGAAGISGKHTLALTNRGSATAADIVALAREVRSRVQDTFGITLVPEPVLVGVTL